MSLSCLVPVHRLIDQNLQILQLNHIHRHSVIRHTTTNISVFIFSRRICVPKRERRSWWCSERRYGVINSTFIVSFYSRFNRECHFLFFCSRFNRECHFLFFCSRFNRECHFIFFCTQIGKGSHGLYVKNLSKGVN